MGQPRGRTRPSNISMTSQIAKVLVALFLVKAATSSAVHHTAPHHGYGHPKHEYPKHNCTVEQVEEEGETCTPTFTTVCEPVTVVVKRIVDKEQCYPVTRTVCSESVEAVPNEICVYAYQAKEVPTEAKTVAVVYTTPCTTQMVDMDMTCTARRLLRKLATMPPPWRMTSSHRLFSSQSPSSSVSTSPLTWWWCPARTWLRRSASLSQRWRCPRRLTRCAEQSLGSPTVTPSPLTCPKRDVSRLSTAMLMGMRVVTTRQLCTL